MLRALQGDSRTNILATPSVVTRDNQEAKMEVAQEIPFLTGQYSTTNGTGSAFQTIERQEVGTILTVTPIINEGDAVMLKLQVESSSLAASAQGAVDLITNKRVITTNVLIKDGGTLVLGGLIQDSVTNSEQGVPFLSQIPLLGELFKTRNNEKTKTNFLIFLQPHILRDDDQAAIETDAKYNYIRGEQKRVAKDPAILPLAPYQPVDPLPAMIGGHTVSGILSPDIETPKSTAPAATPLAPSPTPAPAPTPTPAPPARTPSSSTSGSPPRVSAPRRCEQRAPNRRRWSRGSARRTAVTLCFCPASRRVGAWCRSGRRRLCLSVTGTAAGAGRDAPLPASAAEADGCRARGIR